MRTKIIGICGGSCSGKTTLARNIESALGQPFCTVVFQDSFYKDQSDKFDKDGGQINFDHPDAIDFELMATTLAELSNGNSVEIPQYDFKTHKRLKETTHLRPENGGVVLVDGTLILHSQVLRPLFYRSVFLETSEQVRFERRKKRDVEVRGRSLDGVIAQFNNHVKPMHDVFVEPSKKYATFVFDSLSEFQKAKEQVLEWSR